MEALDTESRSRIAIVSGRNPPTRFESYVNHRAYADRHGYRYIHCNWPTKSNSRYYNKIYYLLEYVDLFDYIFWIDDDAFFFDFTKDLGNFLPSSGKILSFCKSPDFKTLKTFLSSGQFFVKGSDIGKNFLKDILTTDLDKVKTWWTPDLGFFTNGDQDAIIYLLHTNEKYAGIADLYNYRSFNSRPENILENIDAHNPFIVHFTGTAKAKWSNYMRIQREFDLSPALVEEPDLSDYNLVASSGNVRRGWSIRNYYYRVKSAFIRYLSDLV